MKRTIVLLLLAAMMGVGCSTRYAITLQNGSVITTLNKPKYDKEHGVFVYKQIVSIPAGSVAEIAPASSIKQKPAPFIPQPTR